MKDWSGTVHGRISHPGYRQFGIHKPCFHCDFQSRVMNFKISCGVEMPDIKRPQNHKLEPAMKGHDPNYNHIISYIRGMANFLTFPVPSRCVLQLVCVFVQNYTGTEHQILQSETDKGFSRQARKASVKCRGERRKVSLG